jgi:anaerobic magnesium-protoporphyrin IX monomethyl ester cyclase
MTSPVCLIIAPSGFLLDERVFMSLGILRVAAVLEQRGIPVELLDLSGIENYEEVVRLHAAASPAMQFGITATTPQMPAAVRVAETIKSVRPNAVTILGGPHITLVSAAVKREQRTRAGRATAAMETLKQTFDVLVAGDGETAIFLALEIGRSECPAFIDADEPKSSLFLTSEALTRLPFPARHLVDVDSYHYTIDGQRALSLIAQLGCPFECGFCGGRSSPMLRKIRTRSTDNIIEEMVEVYTKYGVTGFMFYDDELNVNKEIVSLMRGIRAAQDKLGVEWRLRGFAKAELFTEEQAKEMYAAGFRWLLIGFESGAPSILTNINKKASREDNTRCLDLAANAGLKVKALMSVGHPGESPETIQATRDWLITTKPADFDVTIITTYPGTPYYDEAVPHESMRNVWTYTYKKTGDRLHAYDVDYTRVAEYYKGNPDGGYHAYVFTDALGAEELVKARDHVERDVRAALNIPFNPGAPATRYEHSMGQFGQLPPNILRHSSAESLAQAHSQSDVRNRWIPLAER